MILKTSSRILKIHPKDNIVVALCDLNKGLTIQIDAGEFQLVTNVASKHKLSIENLNIGDYIFMYGVVVGKAVREIQKGESITTFNISHQTESYELPKFKKQIKWEAPKSSDFLKRTFLGYHRDNGAVGTENNWLIIPISTLGVIFIGNNIGLYCLVGVSFFMSLMFPTIYGIALGGLTEDESKIGSAGLVMAIVGGALMPKLQGMLIDLGGYGVNDITILGVSEVNFSFILPALCFVYITLFGLKTSNV